VPDKDLYHHPSRKNMDVNQPSQSGAALPRRSRAHSPREMEPGHRPAAHLEQTDSGRAPIRHLTQCPLDLQSHDLLGIGLDGDAPWTYPASSVAHPNSAEAEMDVSPDGGLLHHDEPRHPRASTPGHQPAAPPPSRPERGHRPHNRTESLFSFSSLHAGLDLSSSPEPDPDAASHARSHHRTEPGPDTGTETVEIDEDCGSDQEPGTNLVHAYGIAMGFRTPSGGALLDGVDNLMRQEASIDAAFLPPGLVRRTLLQGSPVRAAKPQRHRKRTADDKGRVCKP